MDSRAKILVIEDDRMLRLTVTAYLEDNGYGVCEADNGVAGLAVVEREKPDVVVSDLRMPGLDGFEVLARLKQQAPATPVIIITGTGDASARQEALVAGACQCLTKPISDLDELGAAIERALGLTSPP
jgi:CheY-like chemotaxis protein